MIRSPQHLVLGVLLGVVVVVFVHEHFAGASRIKAAVSEGVTGLTCSDLRVETSSASHGRGYALVQGALHMPATCNADLRRRVAASGLFQVQRCNIVERCWHRTAGTRTYTFIFYTTYTSFRAEEHRQD